MAVLKFIGCDTTNYKFNNITTLNIGILHTYHTINSFYLVQKRHKSK